MFRMKYLIWLIPLLALLMIPAAAFAVNSLASFDVDWTVIDEEPQIVMCIDEECEMQFTGPWHLGNLIVGHQSQTDFYVRNDTLTKTFTVNHRLLADVPAGVTVTVEPGAATLGPGESQMYTMTVAAANDAPLGHGSVPLEFYWE